MFLEHKSKDTTSPKSSRSTILLSINAAAILIAGILIASAIWLDGGIEFKAVSERTDIVEDQISEVGLIDSTTGAESKIEYTAGTDDYVSTASHVFDGSEVSPGELWNEKSITIYATPDVDICVSGGLSELGKMYWQTSNVDVISGFYDSARTWLGYDSNHCRYPIINGYGTTTVTAGTYDGRRKDSITVTVIEPPVIQWEHEVLTLVNQIRTKNKLNQLSWGITCETAADVRAEETKTLYSHVRPDGSSWSTVCPLPDSGGISGENLAIGNAAVSPATVVSLWMSSEAHRSNILNPDYTKLAVGFNFDLDSEYKTHWAQFFSTY